MPAKDKLDWLVEDSEDEGGDSSVQPLTTPPVPPPQKPPQASEISEFTSKDTRTPLDKASSISQFTVDKPSNVDKGKTIVPATASASSGSSTPATTGAADAVVKPKPRPRPRPAFKGPLAATESIETSSASPSTASKVAGALNTVNTSMPSPANLDTPFPLDISERAKMRHQSTSAIKKDNNSTVPRLLSSSVTSSLSRKIKEIGMVIDMSSDEERRRPVPIPASSSMSGRTTILNTSDSPQLSSIPFPIPPLPRRFNATTLPPSDPPSSTALTPFEHLLPNNNNSTPPSSPVAPRQVKRRKIIVDEEDFDPSKPDAGAGKKEKKPRDKQVKKVKSKVIGEASAVMSGAAGSTSAPAQKKRSKPKDGTKDAEFKSKEFIDTSDDDLDFLPSAPKSSKGLISSASVPASLQISVPPSAAVSDKPSLGSAAGAKPSSASVPPSAPVSVPPSAALSEKPSVVLSNPVPPPVIELSALRDVQKKKKRPSKALADDEAGVSASSKGADGNPAPKKRARKDEKAKIAPPSGPEKPVEGAIDIDDLLDTVIADSVKSRNTKGTRAMKGKVVLSDDSDSESQPVGSKSTKKVAEDKEKEKPSSAQPEPPAPAPEKVKVGKGRKKRAIQSDDESDEEDGDKSFRKPPSVTQRPSAVQKQSIENKENQSQSRPSPFPIPSSVLPSNTSTPAPAFKLPSRARSSTPHTLPHGGSVSALLRRVSSKVNSPLASPSPSYKSPLSRSTRSALSRIAPLHPNRKEPPPPPPKPPAPKKTKKMLELEEKWEEELAESVEGWACLPDDERAAMRRAKRDMELGYDD